MSYPFWGEPIQGPCKGPYTNSSGGENKGGLQQEAPLNFIRKGEESSHHYSTKGNWNLQVLHYRLSNAA